MRRLCFLLLLSGCGDPARDVSYAERRTAPALKAPVRKMSDGERFGAGPSAPAEAPSDMPLSWDTPPGWAELAPTQMRMINFKVGDEGECYLTILGGSGGGVSGNVNRWRGQLGLEDLSEASVENLPRMNVLGRDGYRIDLEGAYRGMGTVAKEGWALRGVITNSARFTLFVKFTGPQALVERETAGFESFCSSLGFTAEAGGGMSAPPGSSTGATSGASDQSGDGGGFSWDVPSGWIAEAGSGMRLVTFRVGAVECYVVILGGDGGGVLSNLQRWAGQLGQEPPTEADVAAMAIVDVLGVKAPLLEATGDFTGMGSAEATPGTTMLGLPVIITGRAVFVKMLGPTDQVAAQRDNFILFSSSLTLEDDGR
jgi:hypothetical protein